MENIASIVIANLGGTSEAARFFGIASESVSEWKARGVIPKARLRHLQDVRPDVLPTWLQKNSSPGATAVSSSESSSDSP